VVFGAFSLALVVSAVVGPVAGRWIDRAGGRSVLLVSNLVLAAGLLALAASSDVVSLALAWTIIGVGMGLGLYDSAFATLAGIYGARARPQMTGITLIAGFASTLAWPLTSALEEWVGWQGACIVWAGLHLALALPLNALLPSVRLTGTPAQAEPEPVAPSAPHRSRKPMVLLSLVFAITWFSSTALAAHLPGLLVAAGASPAAALAAAALVGPAQVAARLAEGIWLQRLHPIVPARLATLAHPAGALILAGLGGAGAVAFTVLHGAGNGALTIAKGTLPLALFGPDGYGARQGLLSAPARVMQAFAPLLFGWALMAWGAGALWITASLHLVALAALMAISRNG
jgi:predicted MFS family arabinose efflux permease